MRVRELALNHVVRVVGHILVLESLSLELDHLLVRETGQWLRFGMHVGRKRLVVIVNGLLVLLEVVLMVMRLTVNMRGHSHWLWDSILVLHTMRLELELDWDSHWSWVCGSIVNWGSCVVVGGSVRFSLHWLMEVRPLLFWQTSVGLALSKWFLNVHVSWNRHMVEAMLLGLVVMDLVDWLCNVFMMERRSLVVKHWLDMKILMLLNTDIVMHSWVDRDIDVQIELLGEWKLFHPWHLVSKISH